MEMTNILTYSLKVKEAFYMLQLSFKQQEIITISSNTKRGIDKMEPDDSAA